MEDFKEGHRERIKQKYINDKNNFTNDYEFLELLLTYSIPRRDVKPIAKSLLNTFGNLNNVLNANFHDLEKVKGVGTNTAVLIGLVRDIHSRANRSKNENVKRFDSDEDLLEFFTNLLSCEKNERIAVVSLDNLNRIINTHLLSEGSASSADVNPRKIIEAVISDNAASVIIAHNHPSGSADPSGTDLNFTLDLRNLLKTVQIHLADHVIVGENGAQSIKSMPDYKSFFK